MKNIHILLLAVLLTAVYTSTIPLNFNFQDFRERFKRPVRDFDPTPLPFYPRPQPISENPCGRSLFCGEAVNFNSEKELAGFVGKNCQNLYYYRSEPMIMLDSQPQMMAM
jgi:hypothetical protein